MPLSSGWRSLVVGSTPGCTSPGPEAPVDDPSSITSPDSPSSGVLASFLRIALIPNGLTDHTRSPAESSTQTRSTFVATVSSALAGTLATTSS